VAGSGSRWWNATWIGAGVAGAVARSCRDTKVEGATNSGMFSLLRHGGCNTAPTKVQLRCCCAIFIVVTVQLDSVRRWRCMVMLLRFPTSRMP